MTDDAQRVIRLWFVCNSCGKECNITIEEELFSIVNSQVTAEIERLHCMECNDG